MSKGLDREISAEKFVDRLLTEGASTSCDTSNDFFSKHESLPDYYDKILFKKGQEFFNKHIYALHLMHEMGVIALYAIPTLLSIVFSYGSSIEILPAYKMQFNINVHIRALYYLNFESKRDWKNIERIKTRHNSVSNDSNKNGFNRINQKDMALGQLIFVGFCMTRGHLVGIHDVTKEEWLGFHHFWRVIGYLIGIEERFNACSIPPQKTKEITEILMEKHFKAEMDKRDPKYLEVAVIAAVAWSAFIPELGPRSAVNHCYNVVQKQGPKNKIPKPTYMKINPILKVYYKLFCLDKMYLMKFDIYRIVRNYIFRFHAYLITTISELPLIWIKVANFYNF